MLRRYENDRTSAAQPCLTSAGHDVATIVSVNRVVIFGCAGSGKSTLARALALRTGLPVIERDTLGRLGSPAYRASVAALTGGQGWIFDGAPYFVEDLVYPVDDVIIFLDYGKSVVMARVLWRTVVVELWRRDAGTHHRQGWAAWRDPGHPIRWAWKSHRDRHDEGLRVIAGADVAGAEIIHFTRPGAAKRWLGTL